MEGGDARPGGLADATKMGDERALLSAGRDIAKLTKRNKKLTEELTDQRNQGAKLLEQVSKQELDLLKLTREIEREQKEGRSTSKLLEVTQKELAQLKKTSQEVARGDAAKLKDATDKCIVLRDENSVLSKKLSSETNALVARSVAYEKLGRDMLATQQKMLLTRDTNATLQSDLRENSSRLRIEANERQKTEDRCTKRGGEIKLLKARLEAESLRAGQLMSALATAKTELAVAMEQGGGDGGGVTPGIVLENDQLKQEREGFTSQIRGLTDTCTTAQVALHNTLRQLEKEKSEHNRYSMLFKERSEELSAMRRAMTSMKESNSQAIGDKDLHVLEISGMLKDMTVSLCLCRPCSVGNAHMAMCSTRPWAVPIRCGTYTVWTRLASCGYQRAKGAVDAELRIKFMQCANLTSEVAQLNQRIVSLRDANAQLTGKLKSETEELTRETKLRNAAQTDLANLTERLAKVQGQAKSDGRSLGSEKEELVRGLATATAETAKVSEMLRKEKKACGLATGAKKMVEGEYSKAMQKSQEYRERADKTAVELGEAEAALRGERVLREAAEKNFRQAATAGNGFEKELEGVLKVKRDQDLELSKKRNALKAALAELGVSGDAPPLTLRRVN